MRLVGVLLTFENNTGHTDGPTGGRTDMTSYRDALLHLKIEPKSNKVINFRDPWLGDNDDFVLALFHEG